MNSKVVLATFFLTLSLTCSAQSNWQWARSAVSSPAVNMHNSIVTDSAGNVYTTGHFYAATLTFGSTTLYNHSTNNSISDVFVTKHDPAGNLVWVRQFGDSEEEHSYGICTDSSGHLFITGCFWDSILTMGPSTMVNSSMSSNGLRSDVFVAKLDMDGNVLWAKSFGGAKWDQGVSVSADREGNVFVCGSFGGPVMVIGNDTLTNMNSGWLNIFLAKFDPNGNPLWARGAGGTWNEEAYGVSVDPSGNVYMTGYFESSSITFGSTVLYVHTTSYADVFIVKYDTNGNAIWAKRAGGLNGDMARAVATDPSGNVYITGYYTDPITFGPFLLHNQSIGSDIFITKYDGSGNVLWAKSIGGTNMDVGHSISIPDGENVYVSGFFHNDTLIFENDTLFETPGNNYYVFVANYDQQGHLLCADALASDWNGNFGQLYVAADHFGNAYVAGQFLANQFVVGPDTLVCSGNGIDLFIAKYSCGDFVGLDEPAQAETILVYPNPSNGIFYLDAKNYPCEIAVYDVQGQKVYEKKISAAIEMDLSQKAAGIYFLTMNNNGMISRSKLIIR